MKTRLPLLLIVCAFASSAVAQSLFVTTRYSNAVAVINSSSDQVISQIAVGAFPIRVAMAPDRRKAYISNGQSSTISVLDTVALTNTATIRVSLSPGESEVTPDGRQLWVVHQVGSQRGCIVDVIDTATNRIITNVAIPGHWAKDILITPNGRFADVANYSEGEVDVINTATYQVTTIPTAGGSRRLAMSPAGDRVYVANYTGNSVSAIDTATQRLIATIPVGQRPRGIAIADRPAGYEIYATNVRDGTVSVINPNTLTVIKTIPTGNKPWEVTTSGDGERAFVSNNSSDNVSVIDTATHAVIKTLPTGKHPFIMAINPEQTKLYVSNSTDTTVTVIDLRSLTVFKTIADVGMAPFDMAFGP